MCLNIIYGITTPKYSTETSMITVKYKKIRITHKKNCFEKFTNTGISLVHRKTDGMEIFLFWSIILKSVLNNASLLVLLPK